MFGSSSAIQPWTQVSYYSHVLGVYIASTNTNVESVLSMMASPSKVPQGILPCYHCELFNFSSDCPTTLSNVVSYTYDAFSLPLMPSSVKNDHVIQSTIWNNAIIQNNYSNPC
jgi:hypothetical protein